ncbi:MAG: glycosyltransferase [Elusimicrobia bacterium]|nr:glycosyltransferase [Elusimicrobiota bacterium]
MAKPKVVLVTKLYHPWIGGVEKHVQDLAEGLGGRFDMKVLCCREPRAKGTRTPGNFSLNPLIPQSPNPSSINGVPVYKVPSLGLYWSMPVAPAFPFWLKKLSAEADILHFHLPFPLAVISHWIIRTLYPRLIVTWHSNIVRQKNMAGLLSPWTQWFLSKSRMIVLTSKGLLDNSPELKNFRNKCLVVPFGIQPERFEADQQTMQKARQIRVRCGGDSLILFVGRLIPYKGLDVLIKAMARISQNARLAIIGQGRLDKKLRELASSLGLSGRVMFLGAKDGDDLTAYYHACDFFVLSSVTPNEAFGLVQLEAMAAGKPVINTYIAGGVPEVSLNGQTGLSVEPNNPAALANAMQKLLVDPNLRKTLGENARQRVREHFTFEKMLAQTAAVYDSI